jgi:hypothetical protein
MPICFRRADQDEPSFIGTPLGGTEVIQRLLGEKGPDLPPDLSGEFNQESLERLRRLKSWSEDPENFVKIVTPTAVGSRPPEGAEHIVIVGALSIYYAIECHEHGPISQRNSMTYYHLSVSNFGGSLELEDPRVAVLVPLFFPLDPPTQVQRCCPHGIHFFKTFEWVH